MPAPCHWIREPGGTLVQIPGCIGGAVHGPEACTCDAPMSRIEAAEAAAAEALELVEELRTRLIGQRDQVVKMMARNAELRRLIAKLKGA